VRLRRPWRRRCCWWRLYELGRQHRPAVLVVTGCCIAERMLNHAGTSQLHLSANCGAAPRWTMAVLPCRALPSTTRTVAAVFHWGLHRGPRASRQEPPRSRHGAAHQRHHCQEMSGPVAAPCSRHCLVAVVFADVGKYLLKAGELGRFAVPIRLLSDFGVAHVRLAVCANNDRNPALEQHQSPSERMPRTRHLRLGVIGIAHWADRQRRREVWRVDRLAVLSSFGSSSKKSGSPHHLPMTPSHTTGRQT
jgi:hypothetical protein